MRLRLFAALAMALSFTSVSAQQVEMRTNQGLITIELYGDKAPITVANFLQYVKDGFYAGTIFHRVIDGFMIQGGGFTRDMREKRARAPIKNEADIGVKAGLRNTTGTLAMARTPNPDSASAQFFINLNDNDFLNHSAPTPSGWGYAVFGKVTKGMDIVQQIAKADTTSVGPFEKVPRVPVIIESVSISAAK